MEFEEARQSGDDEKLVARKRLRKADKEVKKQGQRLKDSVALGHETKGLARRAMFALRGQRDQIVNTVGLVKDIGSDLVRSDKLARDINRR